MGERKALIRFRHLDDEAQIKTMSGVVQSEYRCPRDQWPLVAAALRTSFVVESEASDNSGEVVFLDLKEHLTNKSGVMVSVLPLRQGTPASSDFTIAVNWVLRSVGPDADFSRRIAGQVDDLLKRHGAKEDRGPFPAEYSAASASSR